MESGRGNMAIYNCKGIFPGTALPGGQRMQTCRRNSFNNVNSQWDYCTRFTENSKLATEASYTMKN